MPDVEQIEHAVREDDRPGLALPPGGGFIGQADLGGGVQGRSYSGCVALGWKVKVWLKSGRCTASLYSLSMMISRGEP